VIGDYQMNIESIILLLTNRLIVLRNQLISAEAVGDIESVFSIENEITETELSLAQLSSLV
jgi:hypothetical protein